MATTFKDIINGTLARLALEEADIEASDMAMIKNAINQGYMLICKTFKQIIKTFDISNNTDTYMELPDNVIEIISVENEFCGELQPNDYERLQNSNTFRITNPLITMGDFTVVCSIYPDKLINDADEIKINDFYGNVISVFAAYAYMLMTKKYSAAQLLLNEFNLSLNTNYTDTQMQAMVKSK